MPFGSDKPRGRQAREKMLQRVLFQPRCFCNPGRTHALQGEAHRQAKHGDAARVAEGRERVRGKILFYYS